MALFDPQAFGQRFGATQGYASPVEAATMSQPAPTGMFAAGPTKRSLAEKIGMAGDILTGRPIFQQQFQEDEARRFRQAQLEAQMTQASRPVVQSTGNGGFVVLNPVTGEVINRQEGIPSNDTVNDYNFIAGKLGQGEADKYLRSVAAGPPVAIEGIDANGNQTRTLVPRSQAYGGAPAGPPDGAVQMLRGNPALAPMFDQKYGPGAAQRILGGASPQGPATFP